MTTTGARILETLGTACRDSGRRARLLAQTQLNGIDFVEFVKREVAGTTSYVLQVHFLHDLPAAPAAYGLPADPSPIRVHGGTRIVDIAVQSAATTADPKVLEVAVDRQGDFSPYLLTIGWRQVEGEWTYSLDGIDRLFSVAPVNFRPDCPVDFDCAPGGDCPPDVLPEPALDYLARDYASFRQMLIDLVAQRNPAWTERSPADIGMALLELFAYEGDQLSYLQDAVANEAFLETARQRVSAKRHAKLVDYDMHDGRNAFAYVHFEAETSGTLPPGTQLVTQITSPLRFDRKPGVTPVPQPTARPGTELSFVTDADFRTDPALARVRVFETAMSLSVDPRNNDLRIHSWGNQECCLPSGTTTTYVYAADAVGTTALRAPLQKGDHLLLEELRGTRTGTGADADPTHRQVVMIERVHPEPTAADPIYDQLFLAQLDPVTGVAVAVADAPAGTVTATTPRLPLVQVTWRAADALKFPLCVSTTPRGRGFEPRMAVARGNMVLADHGRTVLDAGKTTTGQEAAVHRRLAVDREASQRSTFRLRLPQGPQTIQAQPEPDPTGLTFPPVRERTDLGIDVHEARDGVSLRPAIALRTGEAGWLPVPDLLGSTEFERHFVADIDDDGRAILRFGDGEYGQRLPADINEVEVWFRVGNGRSGNIGADSLAHLVKPWDAQTWPVITRIRNPLPATGGVDAESIEQVRQYAPAAFRANQLRAVTEQDFTDRALTISGVSGAVASFRWTGSWYTVFVGIDPSDPTDVVTDVRGVTRLRDELRQRVLDALTRFRLTGYDLEIRSARYVPLDLVIDVCVKRGYFRGDVARAVVVALGAGPLAGGGRGVFDPANFTFGQAVHLSRIYAAVENVEGVESATVTTFQRHGHDAAGELASGTLPVGPWEIVRLDNDSSNQENGTLTVTARGGS